MSKIEIPKRVAMNLFKEKYPNIQDRSKLEEAWEEFKEELFEAGEISRYQYATWSSPLNK